MKRHYTTNLYLLLNTDLVVLQVSSMVLQDGETITGHCSGCTRARPYTKVLGKFTFHDFYHGPDV